MNTLKQLAGLCLLALLAAKAQAFTLNPMVVEIDPNKPRAQQVFVLTNNTDREKPIEVSVAKPVVDAEGNESIIPDLGEDEFLIIPQQFVLPPNARRSVRVMYVGDPRAEEDTYRILFKELPVALASDESLPDGESSFRMNVVMQYYTRVWLTPSELKSDLKVASFDKIEMEAPITQTRPVDSEVDLSAEPVATIPMLRFTVANAGQRHGYLRYPRIDLVTRDGRSIPLSRESLENVSGQVILKESEKAFRIPWQEDFPAIGDIASIRLRTVRR